MSASKKVFYVDGGLGRVLCSVPAVEQLAWKGHKVVVVASWPVVFENNPHVHKLYGADYPYLWSDVVEGNELIKPEPYTSYEFYSQQHHLVQSFNFLTNNSDSLDRPNLYFTDSELSEGKRMVDELKSTHNKKKLLLFQPFGATAQVSPSDKPNVEPEISDETHRSLSVKGALSIAKSLQKTNPEVALLNMTHVPFDQKNVPNVITPQISTRMWFVIANFLDGVIGIDSVGVHLAAALSKPCIALFGGSHKENFAYPYDNFTVYMKDGFPKAFRPFRVYGYIEQNQGAMDFSDAEIKEILTLIKTELINTKKEEK